VLYNAMKYVMCIAQLVCMLYMSCYVVCVVHFIFRIILFALCTTYDVVCAVDSVFRGI